MQRDIVVRNNKTQRLVFYEIHRLWCSSLTLESPQWVCHIKYEYRDVTISTSVTRNAGTAEATHVKHSGENAT